MFILFFPLISIATFLDDPLIQKAQEIEQKTRNLTELNLSEALDDIEKNDFNLDTLNIQSSYRRKRIMPKIPLKFYLRQKEILVNNTVQKKRFSFWTFITDLFHVMSGFPYDFKTNKALGWNLPSNSGNFTFLLSNDNPHPLTCYTIQNDVIYDCLPKRFRIDAFSINQQHFYSPTFLYFRRKRVQYFQTNSKFDPIGFRIIVVENYGSNETCLTGLKIYATC